MPTVHPVPSEEVAKLEARLRKDLSHWILDLRVLPHPDGLVLHGRTRNYYSKQLAQHALMRATRARLIANRIEVT
jgi:hypothetical protein